MGKHFALTLQLPNYSREKSRQNSRKYLDYKILGIAIFGAIVLMLIIYLVQVNTSSTKGFEIISMQQQIESLKDQQKNLEVQAAELQSFQHIQGDPAIMSMVPVTSINYIQTATLTER